MIALLKRLFANPTTLYILSCALFLAILVQSPAVDTDFGWHYRYGEYIVKTGQILYHNTFSFTFRDYMWANSYWISQVAIYLLYNINPVALSLAFSASFFAMLWLFSKRMRFSPITFSLMSLCMGIVLQKYAVPVRPLFFSSALLFVAVYVFLYQEKKLSYLPALFCVWANMHADFVLGLFIFGLYVLNKTAALIISKNRDITAYLNLWSIFVFSIIATFINPYSIELWNTLLKETHPYQFSHISEWIPLTTLYFTPYAIYSFILGCAVYTALLSKKAPMWFRISIGCFVLFSIRSVYFARIVAVLIAPFLFVTLDLQLQQVLDRFSRVKIMVVVNSILLLTSFTLIPFVLEKVYIAQYHESWAGFSQYPYQAVQFIKENKLEGRMFNDYSWGGYLIYSLPEQLTFVDGRMASWRTGDVSMLEQYINISSKPEQYFQLLDFYDIAWVLEKPDTRLVAYLGKQPGWLKLYSDEFSYIFVRTK